MRPTAIFAASDMQAVGVLEAAERTGVRVPDDLAVVGYDDIEIAEALRLTTVRQPLAESGADGMALLLRELRDPGETKVEVVQPLSVVDRQTT
jgi:DNA-binding LacI/PurR family transcriptional regulator